jgi:hypothetical protein
MGSWRECTEQRPGDAVNAASLEHVEADHGVVVHDDSVVGLDKAHAAHVGGEVEDVVRALGDLEAIIHDAQVHEVELVAEHVLTHVLVLLPVGRDDVMPLALEPPRDVRRDEPARPRDRDPQFRLWPVLLPVQVRRRVRPKASIARHGYHKNQNRPTTSLLRKLDPENNLLNPTTKTGTFAEPRGQLRGEKLVDFGADRRRGDSQSKVEIVSACL